MIHLQSSEAEMKADNYVLSSATQNLPSVLCLIWMEYESQKYDNFYIEYYHTVWPSDI